MKADTLRFIRCALMPIALLAQMACTSPAASDSFALDAKAEKELDAMAQGYIDQKVVPGLAIGVVSEGKIIYAKGFGLANIETDTKVTPDSVFEIGSNTKQFTAASIMLLAEQGKLSIDDKLSKYFPEFPRSNEVKLRQMLSHTSGIPPFMAGPNSTLTPEQRAKMRSAADFVPILQEKSKTYSFDPGTSWQYSNSGFILLGVIVEKVSGVSFGEFLKKNVFQRAGMTASAMDGAQELPNLASGYNRAPEGSAFITPPEQMSFGTGGGGIRSTVGDMLQWQTAFLSGRVLSKEGVTAMTTPALLKNGEQVPAGPLGTRYAFGLSVGERNGHALIAHTGGGPGFRSLSAMFPDDRAGFIVLTNSGLQMPANAQAARSDQAGAARGGGAQNPLYPVTDIGQFLTKQIVRR